MKYSTAKREKSTSTKGHYVRNADLLPAIIEAKEEGKLTNKLIIMIQMIAERYSRKSNFIGYSFREDIVSAAVENLCKNWHKFNQDKYSNPFAFYTTAIHNSFLQYMADEKKHRNIRDALLVDAGSNPSFNFMQDEKDETHFEVKESDEHYVPEKKDVDVEQGPISKYDLPQVSDALVAPKEIKVRYEARVPSAVTRYGPNDIEIDPVTGAITIKKKPEVVAATPVKTARKPRVPKVVEEVIEKVKKPKVVKEKATLVKKVPAKKVPVKKVPAAKKTPVAKKTPAKSKGATIPETKLKPRARAKKAVEEKAAKKPVAKKAAAKKTTKKAK